MVRRKCDVCGDMFASRQSLFKHKKRRCGKGLHMSSVASSTHIPISSTNVMKKQTSEDLRKSNREKSDMTRILDQADSDQSDLTDDSSDSEDDGEDDYALWESFAMSCNRGSKDILEWLDGMLHLYKWSENDTLFQKLMQDVEWAKENGYSLYDSFNYTVHANKDAIVAAVTDYQTDDFWGTLSSRDILPRCKWFTGDPCHCKGCVGHSLLTKVRRFVELFYGMNNDDTIGKILDEVDDGAEIEESIEQHKDEILNRFHEAHTLIETCGIVDNPNRPKFRVKTDEEDAEDD